MVEIEIKYKDESISLQCNENDILKNILEKSNKEIFPDISSLYFFSIFFIFRKYNRYQFLLFSIIHKN